MFALAHLLQLFSHLPTVGELPFWRGDDVHLLFNPPVEHKFPSILSIDAPPAVLTLDGPPPPAFIHPDAIEAPTYYMTLESEVFYPPSHNQYQHFGYLIVACFILLVVSHSLRDSRPR